jgi:hypothetical protein
VCVCVCVCVCVLHYFYEVRKEKCNCLEAGRDKFVHFQQLSALVVIIGLRSHVTSIKLHLPIKIHQTSSIHSSTFQCTFSISKINTHHLDFLSIQRLCVYSLTPTTPPTAPLPPSLTTYTSDRTQRQPFITLSPPSYALNSPHTE